MNQLNAILTHQSRVDSCDTHGEFESRNLFNQVWSKCPQCAADKQATDQREAEEKAAALRHQEWQKKLGEAVIPDRFRNRTLGSYVAANDGQRRALAFAKDYAERFDEVLAKGCGAIFCGKPGTGKTHLAVGIGLHIMQRNRLVLFVTAQRMFCRIKDSWRKGSDESQSDVIRLLTQPDLLILDEIGVQFGSKFEEECLFDVMNERYEKRKPTLLLSNKDESEVRALIGERVYDRLREDGGVIVPFGWGSHRGSVI